MNIYDGLYFSIISLIRDSSKSELIRIGTTPLLIKLTYNEIESIVLLHKKNINSRFFKNEFINKSDSSILFFNKKF